MIRLRGYDHNGCYDSGDCGHQDDYASGENIYVGDGDHRCQNLIGSMPLCPSKSCQASQGEDTTERKDVRGKEARKDKHEEGDKRGQAPDQAGKDKE